jgi:hypothetical protein
MKKFFTVLSIICLIPGVVGIIMSLFINLYEHEKVIILICGVLAMVFIIIADPGILSPKKDANYNCWLDEEYDDDEEYYRDYDEDEDDDDWEDNGYYYDYEDDDDEGYYDYEDDDDYEDDWEE